MDTTSTVTPVTVSTSQTVAAANHCGSGPNGGDSGDTGNKWHMYSGTVVVTDGDIGDSADTGNKWHMYRYSGTAVATGGDIGGW